MDLLIRRPDILYEYALTMRGNERNTSKVGRAAPGIVDCRPNLLANSGQSRDSPTTSSH